MEAISFKPISSQPTTFETEARRSLELNKDQGKLGGRTISSEDNPTRYINTTQENRGNSKCSLWELCNCVGEVIVCCCCWLVLE